LADDSLVKLKQDGMELHRHIKRACPVMGPERKRLKHERCNHFNFIANLFDVVPRLRDEAVTKITSVLCHMEEDTDTILTSYPFRVTFSELRRELILKLLMIRADLVSQVLGKGGTI
jgi:hypothetical protein